MQRLLCHPSLCQPSACCTLLWDCSLMPLLPCMFALAAPTAGKCGQVVPHRLPGAPGQVWQQAAAAVRCRWVGGVLVWHVLLAAWDADKYEGIGHPQLVLSVPLPCPVCTAVNPPIRPTSQALAAGPKPPLLATLRTFHCRSHCGRPERKAEHLCNSPRHLHTGV